MLDKKEWLILSHLRTDAKKSLAKISQETKIPISTIADKLGKIRRLVKKQTCLLDFSKLGFSTRIYLALKTSKSKKEELQHFLMKNRNINSLYKTHNNFDFIVEGLFTNLKEYEDFLLTLEKFEIAAKEEFHVVEDLKEEDFLNF